MIDLAAIVVGTVASLWLGSIEWRLRNMGDNMKRTLDKDDVKDLIDLKQEVLRSEQADIKNDLQRLEAKIDKLIDIQLNKV